MESRVRFSTDPLEIIDILIRDWFDCSIIPPSSAIYSILCAVTNRLLIF